MPEEKVSTCPSCGYTKQDAQFHGDHRLCKNAGNAPWETPAPDEAMRVARQVLNFQNPAHTGDDARICFCAECEDARAALIREAGSERERDAFESCARELREHYNSDWDSTVPGAEFDAEIIRILHKHLGEASRLLGGELK